MEVMRTRTDCGNGDEGCKFIDGRPGVINFWTQRRRFVRENNIRGTNSGLKIKM